MPAATTEHANPIHPDKTGAPPWVCPFCALLCDDLGAPINAAAQCPRARQGMQALQALRGDSAVFALNAMASAVPDGPAAWIDGRAATFDQAVQAAAERLATWRQPLFGGMATCVSGARALYRLAAQTQAICDHVDGDAQMHGLRALQDRGQIIATLGELRTRAETIVLVGSDVTPRYPRFFERIGLGHAHSPCQRLVFWGAPVPPGLARAGLHIDSLPGSGDLFADSQELAACVDAALRQGVNADWRSNPRHGPRLNPPAPGAATQRRAALQSLAEQLCRSPYAVLVWDGATLPAQGALLVEALNRIAGQLNGSTRAATFGLGGNDGAASVNQTFTWLGGLPLRTRLGGDPGASNSSGSGSGSGNGSGMQHEPHRYATARLIDEAGVDGILWVNSFSPRAAPPSKLPCITLGPPCAKAPPDAVYLAVATPGWSAPAHLFRTDGPVLLPLAAAHPSTWPTVADTAQALMQALAQTPARMPVPAAQQISPSTMNPVSDQTLPQAAESAPQVSRQP